jgi:hypothetical protein
LANKVIIIEHQGNTKMPLSSHNNLQTTSPMIDS